MRVRLLIALFVLALPLAAQTRERSTIPSEYTWKLADIYPSDDAWRAAKEKFVAQLPGIKKFNGTLAQSPQRLLEAVDTITNLNKDFSRLYVYASMMADTDTRAANYQAIKQEMNQLGATLSAETSFFVPEVLKMDPQTIEKSLSTEPRLQPNAF
jgi:oligoendopeptidase F